MTIFAVCASEDVSEKVIPIALSLKKNDQVMVVTYPALLTAYAKRTDWYTKQLSALDLLRPHRLFIVLPDDAFSFKMLLRSILLPYAKQIVLLDGRRFPAKNFIAWCLYLKRVASIHSRISLVSVGVVIAMGAGELLRILLFRLIWDFRRLQKPL